MKIIKLGFVLFLAVWGLYGAFHNQVFWILDGINLALHEAGHPLFGFFGEFIGFLGGTIMQLLMPTAVMISFLRRGEKYSASVILFWIGENFFHIAPYVRDARTQQLPLVGGGQHDWGYLLGKMNLLHYDQQIGNFIWAIGFGLIVLSLVQSFRYSLK